MSSGNFQPFKEKMEAEGLSQAAVLAFERAYSQLVSGAGGTISESTIEPATGIPNMADVGKDCDPTLLQQTVVLKLNGGLGTSMGLDKAKSLLPAKGNDTFLDITAKQVMAMRSDFGFEVKFMLMNSFSTSDDTLSFLKKYPALSADKNLELMQNKVPKVLADTMAPAAYPINPSLEWCPPGHGDLYAALYGSGKLQSLLDAGYKYMFVSNSDNLGATLDLQLLTYFAKSSGVGGAAGGAPFMMECCERTENDKKGGHLAVRTSDKQLILRESAQCPDEDEKAFQDVSRHRFFNTNNLWIRLDKLMEAVTKYGGLIPLPTIINKKTVDPKDGSTAAVVQLETAMGAAIECFQGATAIVVPRSRFAPVKKCQDLFLLRSDCYVLTEAYTPQLAPERNGTAPVVALDSKKCKLVQQLEVATTGMGGGGIPSLIGCDRLTVKGEVWFSQRTTIRGAVTITNGSTEAKCLPPGVYENTDVDLTSAPGLGLLLPEVVSTAPIAGQKPGTSGLRKKTREFMTGLYLHNFIQSTLDAVKERDPSLDFGQGSLLIGGDGRFFNREAIQTIVKIAAGNGVGKIQIAKDGLLSTPAASAVVREKSPQWKRAWGAFILSASHNPGGIDEDFGIKYNCENGGPAPEGVTESIYRNTLKITQVKMCNGLPEIDLATVGTTTFEAPADSCRSLEVEVFDGTENHVQLLKTVFDFASIKALLSRTDFSMVYDSMNGVQGPYAKAVLCDELGLDPSACLLNGIPLEDFGGLHADPNLTYARQLCDVMGVDKTGQPMDTGKKPSNPVLCCLSPSAGSVHEPIPSFGAAADGDADRNMILGSQFFVTPSDSLAVLAAQVSKCVPFFKAQGGLKSVARSMPTSGAVDRVAKKLNLKLFETPTGWKFFGNLMDSKDLFAGEDYCPLLCGEESFGTGSNHVREKDGMWAVLAWLSVLAYHNGDPAKPLVSVEEIVKAHWAEYGRNYYCRYDYEGVDKEKAMAMMDHMRGGFAASVGQKFGNSEVAVADEFAYTDPVDGSVSKGQGIRYLFTDGGSRVVFRLSGTAGSGATVRVYLEKYEPDPSKSTLLPADALGELVTAALSLSQIAKFTGREKPTVIT